MNPKDYLTPEEQSNDVKIAGRLQDINIETSALAARTDGLTDLESANFEALMGEFSDLEAQHEKLHREARARYISQAAAKGAVIYRGDAPDTDPLGEPDSIESRTFNDPWNVDEIRSYPGNPEGRKAELRARALSAIEQMPGITDRRRQVMTDLIETNPRMAELALHTSSPHYLKYWAGKLRHGDNYMPTEPEKVAVQRAMSLTDAEGGFLVPFQLDPSVIITDDGSLNQIRQVARVVQATGDVWNGVSSTGVSFSWDAEASEASDDATTFAQPTVPIYKAVGFVPISIEALQDEQNVTSEIGRLLAFGKDVHDAAAFATGAGGTEPTGIVTALTGGASEISSATTDVFDGEGDVYATHNALPARYRPRSSWLANNAIYNEIRLDSGANNAVWETMGADRPPLLLGRPVYEAEDMDGTVTALAENYVLILGDFSNYVIADRVGFVVETIPHLFATANNRPSGQRGFYGYYRVGADSVNDGGFAMLNVT